MPNRDIAFYGSKLRRVGVVDVGSNSVRLVVFDGAARSPAYFFNEKALCGLGRGVAQSGRLNPEGRVEALAALRRFGKLAKLMQLDALLGVATAAVREAEDGPEFVDQVAREAGIKLKVATGLEEARFAAQGVLLGWPEAEGLVSDIGGSSMELAELKQGQIGARATSDLAPLSLMDIEASGRNVERHIKSRLKVLRNQFESRPERLFLVGGSWRAIAMLHMARLNYPLQVLHEFEMDPGELIETAKWVAETAPEDLKQHTNTSAARLAVTPMAARVLPHLIETFAPSVIAVSAYGLREGLLYEQMPEDLRRRDPLIEGCRHLEASAARSPGFGDTLYTWMTPILSGVPTETLRFIHAACLLHDTLWRAQPDYRAFLSVQQATLANLGGITHGGRVFIGAALSHRYKNGGSARPDSPVLDLLPPTYLDAAELTGRALRLGAMLSGASGEGLQSCALRRTEDHLELVFQDPDLMGGAVEKRLARLARQMGLDPKCQVAT